MRSDPSSRDALAIARRVDWRFLLDDPSLGDVAVAGAVPPDLLAALRARAASVTVDRAPRPGSADVVILRSDGISDLAPAWNALRPGGWLVFETTGIAGWRPRRRSMAPGLGALRATRSLRRAGAEAVRSYIAWPGHRDASAFVPADDGAAMRAWFERRAGGRAAGIAGRAGALAARSRSAAALAPAALVVARRPGASGGEVRARGWIADRLAAVEEPSPTGDMRSFVLLTPRFRASRHVVALYDLRPGREGGPRAVLKAARLDDDRAGIEAEATAVRSVASTLGAEGLAPRLLCASVSTTPPYLIESGIDGHPLDPATVRHDRSRAARAVAAFVALPSPRPDPRPLGDVVSPDLEVLRRRGGSAISDLLEATDQALEACLSTPVPVVPEHGDLAHPNLILTPSGSLAAVDWERARPDGLPLHDLVIGLAYVAGAAASAPSPAAVAQAFQDALHGPDPWAATLIHAEADRLAIPTPARGPLLVAPWIRTAAWLADRMEAREWIRDRSVEHWRAMLADRPRG